MKNKTVLTHIYIAYFRVQRSFTYITSFILFKSPKSVGIIIPTFHLGKLRLSIVSKEIQILIISL